jgi:hypothetical protein
MSSKQISKKLDEVRQEIASLKREVELFIPTEQLEAYENTEEIEDNYKAAAEKYPPHEPEGN